MHDHVHILKYSLYETNVNLHSNMKIRCSLFKGLDAGELSSSDEAYSKPKQGHRGQKGKGRPSIRDGPDAIARLINRSPTSDNYKTPTSE